MRTGWQDITVQEWIDLQGKGEAALFRLITGRDLAELETETEAALVAEVLAGFGPLPEVEAGVNVETETLGQFETAKSFLARFWNEEPPTARAKTLPYVFGLYRAVKPGGKWNNSWCMRLAEACRDWPVLEVIPFAVAVLNEIERVSLQYDQLADEGTDEAGEDDMQAFGFYPALHLLTGGDLLKQEEVMQQSVRKVYTHLLFIKKLAARQKEEQPNG